MPGESVLVVDDSPTILKLVQLVLTKAGYRVVTASGGEEGLFAAKEEPEPLALMLLDFAMPDMLGDDVCRAMSADTTLSTLPVVVMTPRGQDVSARFDRLGNVVDYIAKPFSPDALLTVVAHALEKHARSEAEPAGSGALDLHPTTRSEAPEDVDEGERVEPPLADVALSGDLAVISITDILGLLQDQQQTGVITLGRGDARIEIAFDKGRVAFAGALGVPEEFLLGRFLVDADLLRAADLAAVIDARRDGAELLLGADLVSRGLLTPAGLRKGMSLQTSALVYEGLRWGTGRFWFHPLTELPEVAEEASLGLAVDGLVMEGLRRVDEWRLIEREIGDFDMVFVRDDDRLAGFGGNKLLRDEKAVLEYVNGKNSVKEIIYLAQMGSFEVTKMLYRLYRNKLIRRRVAPVAT